MRRGPLPTTSAPRKAGKKHAKRPERSEGPVHSPQALTPGSKRTEKLPSTLLHNSLGASLGLADVPMEIDEAATPPLLMDASFPDDGQQVPELAARARRLFVTPPTAMKPSGVAPPRWGLAIPTWNEVVEVLGEETVAAAAEGPRTEPLQPLSARALEWRRTALTRVNPIYICIYTTCTCITNTDFKYTTDQNTVSPSPLMPPSATSCTGQARTWCSTYSLEATTEGFVASYSTSACNADRRNRN